MQKLNLKVPMKSSTQKANKECSEFLFSKPHCCRIFHEVAFKLLPTSDFMIFFVLKKLISCFKRVNSEILQKKIREITRKLTEKIVHQRVYLELDRRCSWLDIIQK